MIPASWLITPRCYADRLRLKKKIDEIDTSLATVDKSITDVNTKGIVDGFSSEYPASILNQSHVIDIMVFFGALQLHPPTSIIPMVSEHIRAKATR